MRSTEDLVGSLSFPWDTVCHFFYGIGKTKRSPKLWKWLKKLCPPWPKVVCLIIWQEVFIDMQQTRSGRSRILKKCFMIRLCWRKLISKDIKRRVSFFTLRSPQKYWTIV